MLMFFIKKWEYLKNFVETPLPSENKIRDTKPLEQRKTQNSEFYLRKTSCEKNKLQVKTEKRNIKVCQFTYQARQVSSQNVTVGFKDVPRTFCEVKKCLKMEEKDRKCCFFRSSKSRVVLFSSSKKKAKV